MSGPKISIDADLMRIETQGPLFAADADLVFHRIAELLRDHGAAYLLVDARNGISMDNSIRRQVIEHARRCAPTAVAVFGATVPQQGMLIMISSAVQAMRAKRLPLRFASSESDAHAWLVNQRPVPRP